MKVLRYVQAKRLKLINKFFNNYFKFQNSQNGNSLSFESLRKKYDVIIHIGSPKSGTSALQNFFFTNRKLLLKKGIYYPEHGLDKNGISGGHSKLAIALMEDRFNDAQELFDNWYMHAKNTDKLLLLSSEAFFNLGEKMKFLLKNKNILIIAYHRDAVSYLISAHNQVIKRHFNTQTLTQYCELILSNENNHARLINKSFLKIYEEWEALAGKENLIVRSYQEESFTGGKIEKDFINRIGLKFYNFSVQNKKINISYTKDALEAKRIINFVLDNKSSNNHRIDVALQKYSETHNKIMLGTDNELTKKLKSFFSVNEQLIQSNYLENYTHIEKNIEYSKYDTKKRNVELKSLQKVIDYLVKDKIIKSYLLEETLKKLKLGYPHYSVLKLAELLNMENVEDYESFQSNDTWFNNTQLNRMSEGIYKEADFLRDIANLLIKRKDYIPAHEIIRRAFKLRPNGPAIIKLNEQIKKLI